MTLQLGCLLGKNMTLIGLLSLKATRACFLETLRSAPICFHFWHFKTRIAIDKAGLNSDMEMTLVASGCR
jgi:hypothetical protein